MAPDPASQSYDGEKGLRPPLPPQPLRAASSHPGAWGQAGPGRSLQNRLLLQKSHNKRVRLEGPGEGASKAGVDPTLPALETGPFRAVGKAGTEKTGSPPAPPPRPPAPRQPPARPGLPLHRATCCLRARRPGCPRLRRGARRLPEQQCRSLPSIRNNPALPSGPLGATSSRRPSQTPLHLLPWDGVGAACWFWASCPRLQTQGSPFPPRRCPGGGGERPGFCSLSLRTRRGRPLLARGFQLSGRVSTPAGLGKPRVLGPTPRISDSAGPGWSPEICLCKEFSGDAAGLGPASKSTAGEPISERHTPPG